MFDKKLRKICSLFLSLGFLGVNANAYGDISHKEITRTALKYTTHRKFWGFDLSWLGSKAFGWKENYKGYLEKGILEGCVLPDVDEAGYLFYGHFYNPVKCSIDEEFKTSDNKNTESESADKSKSSKPKIIDKNVVIPPHTKIGFDREEDLKRGFHVSAGGVTVVPKGAIL